MRPHGTPDALSEFTRGASDVGRGLSFLLRRPRLWPWAAVPFVLIGLLFAGLAWYCWHLSERWFQATLGASETWWSDPLAWVLGLLFWILVVFVLVFVPAIWVFALGLVVQLFLQVADLFHLQVG